jgi:5'(3')-deoxyribonucleotidase
MTTIYIDFDNTIVESNEKIIELINKKYGTDKTEEDLRDYGYKSIYPITQEEKVKLFESEDFFNNLNFKPGCLDVLKKHKDKNKFIIISVGTTNNLIKKEKWIKDNVPFEVPMVKVLSTDPSKKHIDMKDCIQIDDNTFSLDTNAPIKVLYKDYHQFSWQKITVNSLINELNTWQQIDELLSFYEIYDINTLNRKEINEEDYIN